MGLVWILNGQKEVGLQMVRIWKGIWNPLAQPFEIWTSGRHFVNNHLKYGQKYPNLEWSSFRMVGTIAIAQAKARPFENPTIWNRTFNKSGCQMFQDFKWSNFRSPLYLLKLVLLDCIYYHYFICPARLFFMFWLLTELLFRLMHKC